MDRGCRLLLRFIRRKRDGGGATGRLRLFTIEILVAGNYETIEKL